MGSIDNQCSDDEPTKKENKDGINIIKPTIITNLNFNQSGHNNKPDEKRCEESDDTAKCRDLRAQETVAFWNLPVFLVGLFSVFGLLGTILQSMKSNGIAMKALARDRAWVLSDGFQDHIALNNPRDRKIAGVEVQAKLKNSGQTPALNLRVRHKLIIREGIKEAVEFFNGLRRQMETEPVSTLGPSSIAWTPYEKISIQQIRRIRNQEVFAILAVEIEYNDNFSDKLRVTKFCRRITFDSVEVNGLNSPQAIFTDITEMKDEIT